MMRGMSSTLTAGDVVRAHEVEELARVSGRRGGLLVAHAWIVIAASMALVAWWPSPVTFVVALVLIGGLVAAWYFLWRGAPGSESMRQGLAAYERNQYEAARVHFEKAARDDPENARAHVYLARIARNEGDVQTAIRELTAAIRADTSYAVAYRELGAVMLQTGNYEQARNWYVRAVQRDPGDRASLGYLGCTMMRLGRVQEGMNFLRRAGQGAWSACANAAPGAPGGMPVQPPA